MRQCAARTIYFGSLTRKTGRCAPTLTNHHSFAAQFTFNIMPPAEDECQEVKKKNPHKIPVLEKIRKPIKQH